jgi:hypothetical protein
MPENKQDPKSIAKGCAVMLAIPFLLWIIYAVGCSKESDITKQQDKPQFDSVMALFMSHQFIKDRLKSPGSAKFAEVYESKMTTINDTTFRVKSFVDSQNGFGALLRTHYVCTITYSPKTGETTCSHIKLTPK